MSLTFEPASEPLHAEAGLPHAPEAGLWVDDAGEVNHKPYTLHPAPDFLKPEP